MPKYQLKQSKRYKEDVLAFRKSGNKLALKKIDTLLKEIADQPRTGTGKPEQLKGYSEREIWSRRISDKHRLVYEIKEEVVIVLVLSAYGHYDDDD